MNAEGLVVSDEALKMEGCWYGKSVRASTHLLRSVSILQQSPVSIAARKELQRESAGSDENFVATQQGRIRTALFNQSKLAKPLEIAIDLTSPRSRRYLQLFLIARQRFRAYLS